MKNRHFLKIPIGELIEVLFYARRSDDQRRRNAAHTLIGWFSLGANAKISNLMPCKDCPEGITQDTRFDYNDLVRMFSCLGLFGAVYWVRVRHELYNGLSRNPSQEVNSVQQAA